MKSEKAAIDRLTNVQSQVSSHYFISKNGNITLLVPELYIAWHAGKSKWKSESLLNRNSIGIEITNPGHKFGYVNFTNKQINSTVILIKNLMNKYKIHKKNILGMMPHPERLVDSHLSGEDGSLMFQSLIKFK